jgi:hypothetical protein
MGTYISTDEWLPSRWWIDFYGEVIFRTGAPAIPRRGLIDNGVPEVTSRESISDTPVTASDLRCESFE